MIKHTPGPWIAYKSKSILGGTVYNICQEDGAPYTPNYSDVCQTVEGERDDIQEANANLIAAAPDMLEALKMTVSAMREHACSIGCNAENWHDYQAAMAAIEKAEKL